MRRFLNILPLCWLSSSIAMADPFKAGAEITEVSPMAARTNPANAAFVTYTNFTFFPRMYESSSLKMRYPGHPAVVKQRNGISKLHYVTFMPSRMEGTRRVAYALNEILPPISLNLELNEIPVLLLGQLEFVDVDVNVKVKGGLGGLVAFKVSDRLGLGISAVYRSIGLGLNVASHQQKEQLLQVDLDLVTADLAMGVRYVVVPDRLVVGATALLFSSESTHSKLSSPLLEGGREDTSRVEIPLKKISFGVAAYFDRLSLHADLEYTRANAGQSEFSLVEFREKERDAYATLGFRSGIGLDMGGNSHLAVGYAYMPSAIGRGGTGAGSKAGFGMLDMVKIAAGLEDLTPYYLVTAGARKFFGLKKISQKKKRKDADGPLYYHQWALGAGVGYQNANLGINASGEQPGAFQQTTMFVPIQITYRF